MLAPVSAIYWAITSIRNWFYDIGILKSTFFDIPIVSVGNLAVGGSGKTPMVEYLIRELQNEYNIATLSRGYGRKTKGFLWVEKDGMPSQTGDEPLQIKSKFEDIAVAVCEDRVAGVKRILKEKPDTNLIILDDAFQHRAIKPSTSLLLSTYDRPFFKDWLMPSGRLRERRAGAQRADAIIFTKCPDKIKLVQWSGKPMFYSRINYQKLNIEGPVFGFSALADNSVFKTHLENNYNTIGFKEFPDHYNYKNADITQLLSNAKGATLLCTEKDWIKVNKICPQEIIRCLPISNNIEGNQNFNQWLRSHLHVEWAFNNIGSITNNNES
ncbi:MAG: tetraacyldisaccharide 4'-kinase [Bacteroidia bacterium]